MSVLAAAPSTLSIDDLCATFDRGGQVKKRITVVVQALSRHGHLTSPDNGTTYRLQRAG